MQPHANQPEHTEQWKVISDLSTTEWNSDKKLFTKWETSKTTIYCNYREERVNHYTARIYLLPAYMANWILLFK